MEGTNRRRFLAAVGASPLALASGCLGLATQSGSHPISDPVSSWPSFRGHRYNTGFARDVTPTSPDPSIEWTYEAGASFWGSPIVVDGTVYIGSHDKSLYALDAASGDREWSFETGNRIEATPTHDGATVYVGSFDRRLYALDPQTGDERWARDLGGLIRGSPTVWNETVFVGVGCHNLACSGFARDLPMGENGWIYALDAATGETKWEYEVGNEVVSTPAVDGETLYVGASDDTLYALDVASGDVEWTYEGLDMIWSSPALAFGTVYFADWGGDVHAVDADSGEPLWSFNTFSDYISGSVAVDEDAVYVGHTPYNSLDDPTFQYGKMFKLDRETGEKQWDFETTSLEIGSSPVLAGDRLYFGTHAQAGSDGRGVYGITTDGKEEWFIEIGERGVGSSPALLDGRLYFGGTDGVVYAVA